VNTLRLLFIYCVAAVVPATLLQAQPCTAFCPYDTLVMGVTGSAMTLTVSATPGASVTKDASSWFGVYIFSAVEGGPSRREVRILEDNEALAERIGYIYVAQGACLDSIAVLQPGKTCEKGIDGTEGRRFFAGFLENYSNNGRLELIMTAAQPTAGTITQPRGSYAQTFALPANTVTSVGLSPVAQFCVSVGETVENKGVLIEAEHKISLYASNSENMSSDATNILPIEALGDEYYTLSYNGNIAQGANIATPEEYLIVATEDNTLITIVPISETGGTSGSATVRKAAGNPFNVRLHKGQTYLLKSYLGGTPDNASYYRSMTGSYIKSTRLIAVFAGHKRAKVGCPNNLSQASRDNLYQQLSPLRLWGTRYAVVSTGMQEDLYRIVAAYDNTSFSINGVAQAPLARGEYRDFMLSNGERRWVESDQPISVGLFGVSQTCFGVERGDPFMVVLNPVENEISNVTFAALPLTDIRDQYVNIIVQQPAKTVTTLSNAADVNIPLTFHDIAGSNYAYARVQIQHGSFHLRSAIGFTAYVYGFGNAESYAYSVGARFNHLTPPAISPDTSYCVGEVPKQLADYSIEEGTLVWYDSPDTEVSLNDSLPTLTTLRAQTYTFWASRMVDCGESPRRSMTIVVHPLPEISFTDTVACNVATAWEIATPAGGTYTGAGCTGGSFYPALAGVGTHTVTYAYRDARTCLNTATDTITVVDFPSHPLISAGGTTTFCAGQSVLLAVDAPDALSYQWYRNGAALPDSTGTQLTATESGTYTVMAKCLASPSNPIVVTVYPLPTQPLLTVESASTFCAGGSATLHATAENADRYRWYRNGVAVPDSVASHFLATQDGAYVAVAENVLGCCSEPSAAARIDVYPLPEPPAVTLQGASSFCDGASALLIGTGIGTHTPGWQRNGATIPGANTDRYEVRTTGIYRLAVEDAHGCTSVSPPTSITVYPLPVRPVITSTDPPTFCSGGTALLQADAPGATTYRWYRNNNLLLAATGATCTVAESGTYTLFVEDAHHCAAAEGSLPWVVTVYQRPAAPSLTAAGSTSFCPGQSVLLEATAPGAQYYVWLHDGLPAATTTVANLQVSEAGDYSVAVYGDGDCPPLGGAGNVIPVTLFDTPGDPVFAHVPATEFCSGLSTLLTVYATGATAYEWYRDEHRIAGIASDTHTVFETGVYTVRALNHDGCRSQNTAAAVAITVHDLPLVPVITSAGPPFYIGFDYSLNIRTPEAQVQYRWYRNDAFTGATGRSLPLPLLSSQQEGLYRVEAITEHQCRQWSELFALTTEISPLVIPNIFTPNGDEVNENFRIAGLENFVANELTVINKRGKAVYSKVNYNNEWFGDDQPDDIYYYRLTVKDKNGVETLHKGYVHIKRR
jgi:gliding motility-associated-like protein